MIKTGDMTDGLYYIKEKHGVEVGDWDSDHKQWNGIYGGEDTEVLAPVPSYECHTKLKTDCHTLAQKLLQVKPELREWLEVNYGEYL